jgi:hypothetical protein
MRGSRVESSAGKRLLVDGVGGVNHLSDFVGVSEKGDDLVPYSAPALSADELRFKLSGSIPRNIDL